MPPPDERGRYGALLGVACALVLLGAVAGPWVERPIARSVGDVAVTGVRATTGIEVAPVAVVAALGAVVCGVGQMIARGSVRRIVASLGVVVGMVAVVTVGMGIWRTMRLDGALTAVPWLAAAAATGVLGAALRGFGRPGRRLPARYDVDVPPQDSEWRMASDIDDGRDDPADAPDPAAPGGGYPERRA